MSHTYGSSSGEVLGPPIAPPESSPSRPAPSAPPPVEVTPPKRQGVFQQFVKFCVVGLSSTVISLSVQFFFLRVIRLQDIMHHLLAGHPAAQGLVEANYLYLQVAGGFGFVFGVANGFYWNSKWTFPQRNPELRRVQSFRFFSVNIVGFMLNSLVTWLLMQIFANGLATKDLTWQPRASILGAIFLVSFFNFFMNRKWTFKASTHAPL